MKKKLLACLLAVSMVMGMSITALADDDPYGITAEAGEGGLNAGAEIAGESEVETPTIKVNVPTKFNVILNPFQIPYEVGTNEKKQDRVIHVPQYVRNYSDVPIEVSFNKVKVTQDSDTLLKETDVADSDVTKLVSLKLNLGLASYNKTAKKFEYADADHNVTQQFVKSGTTQTVSTDKVTLNAASSVKKTATKKSADADKVTFDDATLVCTEITVDDANSLTTTETITPTVAILAIEGKMVSQPKASAADDAAAAPWTEDDTIEFDVKLNLHAIPNALPAATNP